MTKDEAIERFLEVAKLVYVDYTKRRIPASEQDILAFHEVAARLNEIATLRTELGVLAITLHPWYPVVKELRIDPRWFWSCGYFHKWVSWYLPILRVVPELKAVAAAHDNQEHFAYLVRSHWENLEVPIFAHEQDEHVELTQREWEKLNSSQLELFPH